MSRLVIALLSAGVGCATPPAFDPVTMDPTDEDPEHPSALVEVVIESAGEPMNGIVYVASGPGPHPSVVLLHGFPGSERNLDLAQAMRRAGFNVLFFHYRGAWGSAGRFTFSGALEDVAAAVGWLRSPESVASFRVDPARITLVGHSMGGFMALVAGSELPEVRCIASLAGANLGLMGAAASRDPAQAEAMAQALAGWAGPIRGASGTELVAEVASNAERFDTRSRAEALATRPLLLVAGDADPFTPMEAHHQPLVEALRARQGARLREAVLHADHSFSSRRIALARLVTEWLVAECR